MSHYGPTSGVYGNRAGNYNPTHSTAGAGSHFGPPTGAGGYYGAPPGDGGIHYASSTASASSNGGAGSIGAVHGVSANGIPVEWMGNTMNIGGSSVPNMSGVVHSSGPGGSSGDGWWDHVKSVDNQTRTTDRTTGTSTTTHNNSNSSSSNTNSVGGSGTGGGKSREITPEERASKANQKHHVRLEDAVPEELKVPEQMLKSAFTAAVKVMNKTEGSSSLTGSDGPRARRREMWGGNGMANPAPPPACHKGLAYEEIQQGRRKLPAFAKQMSILDLINNNQVVVISGETGCGKTTQVPQFLMDQYETNLGNGHPDPSQVGYNIVCTQPRRISAIGVAERVAAERGETVGGTVGYQIRLERRASEHTRLLFVTTGILLRRLQADPQLEGVTHVILDEVHERTVDSDFLIIILRDLVQQRPDLRLVLMSATLNADLFCDYFNGAPKLNIPGYTHPVQELYLEDALEITGTEIRPLVNRQGRAKRKPLDKDQLERKASELSSQLDGRYSQGTVLSLAQYDENEVPLDVIIDLVKHIDLYMEEGAILIFLSGWEEISVVHDRLDAMRRLRNWRLYVLHSQMPTSQQRDVFLRPQPNVRKVVIATNIAESSITIDDVVFVIDGGKHKEKSYDPEAKVQSLLPAWVSQASSRQRRGRAGRVKPGRCWHLYPRSKFEEMDEYQLPEIVRTSLESLCLQVRYLGLAAPGEGGVAAFINKALTPPGEAALNNALTLLTRIGALRKDESLTPLGMHLALLPVEPQIGKALVFGCLLGCLDPVLTIAALLSQRNPFLMPMSKKEEADRAKRRFAQGKPSDHLCLYNAYEAWRQSSRKDQANFCHSHFLSPSALRTAADVRGQFNTLLRDAGLIPRDRDQLAELNRHSEMPKYWPVVRAALSAGLYPNVVRVDYGKKKFKLLSADHITLNPHPSSVTAEGNLFVRRWAYYHEMCRTPGGLFIYDLTEASPLALLLFGAGDTNVEAENRRPGALIDKIVTGHHIQGTGVKKKKGKKKGSGVPSVGPFAGVEPWVYFNVKGSGTKNMLEKIRAALEYVVSEHVGGARSSESETQLIDTIAQALVGEEEKLESASKQAGDEHGDMQAYNVDADDDFDYHPPGPAAGEYPRGPEANIYRPYNEGPPSSSSRSSYQVGGVSAGGFHGLTASGGGGGGRAMGCYGGGMGPASGAGTVSNNSSGNSVTQRANGVYAGHHPAQALHGSGRPYVGGLSGGGMSDKPSPDDPSYATAQAAVSAAMGQTSLSGAPSMNVHSRANPGYGGYSSERGFLSGMMPQHLLHRGGSDGTNAGLPRVGGGASRYNPVNGEGHGYHVANVRRNTSGGSQPRPMRPSGAVGLDYNTPTSTRSASATPVTPVSTGMAGPYHYGMPPSAMPIGSAPTAGSEAAGPYMHRSMSSGRPDDYHDHDMRNKRGHW